jgi:hypothetical protein
LEAEVDMVLGLLEGFISAPTLFLFIIPMFLVAWSDNGEAAVIRFVIIPGLALLGAFVACLIGNPFSPEFTFFKNVMPWMAGVPAVFAFLYSKL